MLASFASLSSCAPKPPDVPVCENLSQRLSEDPVTHHLVLSGSPTCLKEIGELECGHCVLLVTGIESFIGENEPHRLNGKPWSQIKRESALIPVTESYAPLAKYIIDSCAKMNCSEDVTRFKIKLDALNGIASALKNP